MRNDMSERIQNTQELPSKEPAAFRLPVYVRFLRALGRILGYVLLTLLASAGLTILLNASLRQQILEAFLLP